MAIGVTIAGCSQSTNVPGSAGGDSGSTSAVARTSCDPGQTLTGATYDLSKSRFAFGSTPTPEQVSTMTRWVGSDGVVAIESCGSEQGIMNAGAPEENLPDWNSDPTALAAHVRDYFVSMGVDPCQIASDGVTGFGSGVCSADGSSCQPSAGSSMIDFARGVDGIRVVESRGYARFNVNDQTTSESLYWPTISADTVTSARSFAAQLADPSALAVYKAGLPSNAQGDGGVVIHHSSCMYPSSPFQSAATYDVLQDSPSGMMRTMVSFDAQGNRVATLW
jgi:hypothetical protein